MYLQVQDINYSSLISLFLLCTRNIFQFLMLVRNNPWFNTMSDHSLCLSIFPEASLGSVYTLPQNLFSIIVSLQRGKKSDIKISLVRKPSFTQITEFIELLYEIYRFLVLLQFVTVLLLAKIKEYFSKFFKAQFSLGSFLYYY